MAGRSGRQWRIEPQVLAVYYLTIAAFLAASFFPESRLWGINGWGYFPLAVSIGLFVIGGIIPPLILRSTGHGHQKSDDISDRIFITILIGMVVGAGLLFHLLRARTHFLGDGYLLLSTISAEQLFIKLRNLGSMGLPKLLMGILSGSAETRALLAYQVTAIAAGLVFLAVLILSARRLISTNRDRLLFTASLACGGWMLLFFGYVENYALFVVSVLAYGLGGLIICQGKLKRWWILLLQAIALFFHIFGAALLPATIYLLVSDTEYGRRIANLRSAVKWTTASATAVVAMAVFSYFYTTDYFFRFAFVPLVTDRFTADGYTLISGKHLLDVGGLLLMLLPGLPLLLVSVFSSSRKNPWSTREARFLILASAVALGCAFLFDPKLGMPRDWDLFSFCGIPVGLLVTWLAISDSDARRRRTVLLMSIALSVLLLIPRVVTQADPGRSAAMVKNYIDLDKSKTSSARFLLAQYYTKRGEMAAKEQLDREWAKDLGLNQQFQSARQLWAQGRTAEAYPMLRHIAEVQPNMHQAWTLLSDCYQQANMLDSALYCLRVSDGLNPYNAGVQNDIGKIYYRMGDLDNAELYFRKSLDLDSLLTPPRMGLALVHKERREIDSYLSILQSVTQRPNTPPEFYCELINHYLQTGQFDLAMRSLAEGIAKGLDSGFVQDVHRRYPDLKLPTP